MAGSETGLTISSGNDMISQRPDGGIGRRKGLKIPRVLPVPVRSRLRAPPFLKMQSYICFINSFLSLVFLLMYNHFGQNVSEGE